MRPRIYTILVLLGLMILLFATGLPELAAIGSILGIVTFYVIGDHLRELDKMKKPRRTKSGGAIEL